MRPEAWGVPPMRKTVDEAKRLLTYYQVADQLGVGLRTVKRWRSEGKLRAVRIGRVVRFRPEDVQRLVEKGAR